MHVTLLGTGSADRWPNPWCSCPRCAWARRVGAHRNRTSALVDGCLLIDPGPDAGSGGVELSGVRTVLVTHDHPDHLDPAFLLAWAWAGGARLTVAGPGEALERCRPWVAPGTVTFQPLVAGQALWAGHLHVRALPAAHSTTGGHAHDGSALLYDVAAGDARLLYATDTAALPHGDLAEHYDLVLLELTFGDRLDHGTAHLDLASFGHEVSRLRSAGRLDRGRVVAVHLSHHNPTDLADRLASVGAELVEDGSSLVLGPHPPCGPPRGRRLLVTGGARSGKSRRAEGLAADREVTYVATAPARPEDPDWVQRVEEHRSRRPGTWQVEETPDVVAVLGSAGPGRLVLVDCLSLWVTALVDAADAWADGDRARQVVDEACDGLVAALATAPADVVLVTNEVGSGVVPRTASGRLFRDLLGRVNLTVAAACDDVELVTCGVPQALKGTSWTRST